MPEELSNLFVQQRRRLRCVLRWELLGRVVAGVVAALWVGLLLDWGLEPTPEFRQVAYFVAAFGLLVWVARKTIDPLLRPVTDVQLAALVERRHPEFRDSLLTTLSIANGRSEQAQDPALAAATVARARSVLQQIGEPAVFSSQQARKWITLAVVGLLTVGGFCAAYTDVAQFYGRRLALSDEAWPRRVALTLVGFDQDEDGVWRRKIARGDAVEIAVRAELTQGHLSPRSVWLRYDFADGPRGRESMARVGEPTDGDDAHQLFRHTIADVRSEITMRVYGGDGRVSPIEVIVAPRPAVTAVEVVVAPPAYLSAATRRVAAAALDSAPEGARVSFYVTTSKPLASATAAWAGGAGPELSVSVEAGQPELLIESTPVAFDGTLLVGVVDTDGIESASPHPIPLAVQVDQPPRAMLRLVGVGSSITPDAAIGLELELEDDHALGAASVDMTIDGDSTPSIAFDTQVADRTQAELELTIDLLTERYEQGLDAGRLQPGQRIAIGAAAADRCDLHDGDRTTVSQRYTLDVVTPNELLAQIEEREINLRRTFEETTSDARKLERMVALPPDADEPAARRRLRASRLVEDAAKLRQETLAAAEAFRAIHLELVHNRIQNDDLLQRVNEKIARPLFALDDDGLSALQEGLRKAQDASGPAAAGDELAVLAGSVAVSMEAILEQMRSLETYNEVLAMLRQVIDDQQRVQRATEKTRRDQVRRLLLD